MIIEGLLNPKTESIYRCTSIMLNEWRNWSSKYLVHYILFPCLQVYAKSTRKSLDLPQNFSSDDLEAGSHPTSLRENCEKDQEGGVIDVEPEKIDAPSILVAVEPHEEKAPTAIAESIEDNEAITTSLENSADLLEASTVGKGSPSQQESEVTSFGAQVRDI